MLKKPIAKLAAALLLVSALAFPVFALRNSTHRFFAPRYSGKSIASWFPHWYLPGKAPNASPNYSGPDTVGLEAVPFLVRELSLEEVPEHRWVESLGRKLPSSWANHLPRPYPPILHRQNLMLWLGHILRRPGGPTALAEASKTALPVPRRRLLHLLGGARSEYPAVLDALRLGIADPDPQVHRIAGRALLQLEPTAGAELIPSLLIRVGNDTAPDGIEFWQGLLPKLTRYPQHRDAVKSTLTRLAAMPVAEAAKVLVDLETPAAGPPKP